MNSLTSPPQLQVQQLVFAYPGQPALLQRWSASLPAGLTVLHGDMGSGKSTVLRLLAGTQAPDAGQVRLVRADAPDVALDLTREVFHVEPWNEAHDQISANAYAAALHADDVRFDLSRWQSLVEGLSLHPHVDKPLYMLSTGSKRKVWLATALACGRALVLLDEPTGGLDAPSTRCLWQALRDLAAQGRSVIVLASAVWPHDLPLAGVIELPLRAEA
jgi:ABC-type multidrug transport system ATPase subunit